MDVRGDHDFDGHVDFDDLFTYESGDFFIWYRISSQVPYQSTKFCQNCGIVKEPFTLDKDIAFQVNNVNSKGRESVGIWTCRSGIMMLIFTINKTKMML